MAYYGESLRREFHQDTPATTLRPTTGSKGGGKGEGKLAFPGPPAQKTTKKKQVDHNDYWEITTQHMQI